MPALLLALIALLLLPAAPAAAAAKAPTCTAGQIEVLKKPAKKKAKKRVACRTILRAGAQPRDPAAIARSAGIGPAKMRAALPKKLRKRYPLAAVKRVEQAIAKQSARARAASRTARAAAAGDCGTAPAAAPGSTQTDNGTKITTTGGSWGQPNGATWGVTATVTATREQGGASVTQSQTTKTCVSWDTCPDAEGRVTGTGEYSLETTTVAAQDGLKVTTRTVIRATAKLVGHVGGDARVTAFDWNAEGTATSRGEARQNGRIVKTQVGPTVRVVASKAGVDPRGGARSTDGVQIRSWGVNGSVLDGSLDGAIAGAEALAVSSLLIADEAARALLGAEKVWYDQAACLDVVLDPNPAEAEPGQQVPVAVKVKTKDGQEIESPFTIENVSGSVAPMAGTTSTTVTWTAPEHVSEEPMHTFDVVAVSERGRAIGDHTAQRPKSRWWSVAFEGAGEYHRHEPRSTPYPQLWSEIHYRFRMVSEPARITDGYAGSRITEVSGDANATRVDGGGTSTCDSAVDGENHVGMLRIVPDGDGFSVRPTAFAFLTPLDRSCLFDDMLHWMDNEVVDAMTADVHVSQAELAAHDRIERPVEADLAPSCWGGAANGDWPCTQTVRWQGRVVLERVGAP